ncbi:Uncharacterised protein [Chlamydia trachomatis]|nr:Uncharacterised protein [Chlamydia trachomatis]
MPKPARYWTAVDLYLPNSLLGMGVKAWDSVYSYWHVSPGIKLRSLGWVASAFTHRASSLAP